jgi:hypothetical protein
MSEEKKKRPRLHLTGTFLGDDEKSLALEVTCEGNTEIITTMLLAAASKEPMIRIALDTASEYLKHEHPVKREDLVDALVNRFATEHADVGDMDENTKAMLTKVLKGMVPSQGDA